MPRPSSHRLLISALIASLLAAPSARAQAQHGHPSTAVRSAIDWNAVDAAMGRTGAVPPGSVYRFGMRRSDLAVTSQRVRIRPSFALGSQPPTR